MMTTDNKNEEKDKEKNASKIGSVTKIYTKGSRG
mgnify:CR=1 FL=1